MLLVGYLILNLEEWGLVMQHVTILLLYVWLRYLTDKIENEKISKMMEREKIQEELNLSRKKLEDKNHLFSALGRKFERLKYMRKFSDHLKEARNLDDVGRIITHELRGLIPEADQILLYVADEATRELGLIAYACRKPEFKTKDKKGDEYDAWVMKRSQPLIVEDANTDFRFLTETAASQEFRSLCVVPLIVENHVNGVLHLSAQNQKIFETDIKELSKITERNFDFWLNDL